MAERIVALPFFILSIARIKMASGITDDKTLYMVPQASKNTIQRV